MVRYADDFVILCQTRAAAEAALALVQSWVASAGLTLHPAKTRLVDSRTESFAFLGYEFRGVLHWPRKKSIQKLKATLRPKTKRSSGRSLPRVIGEVNQTLRGWFAYFQHSSSRRVYRDLDAWVRDRLRGILRRRRGLRGRASQADQERWRNSFFVEHGLYSLVTAHASASQSSRR